MRIGIWILQLRDNVLAFGLALALGAVLVTISEVGYQRASGQLSELVLMGQLRLELVQLMRRVRDAESSQRGYLLTARKEYLAPYQDARTDVDRALSRLVALQQQRSDDPDAEANAADLLGLSAHGQTKLSEMNEVLGLFEHGKRDAAQELMLTGIGRDAMVSMSILADRMLARENARVATGLRLLFGALALNRVGIAAGTT